jgi:hypothetical protein
MLGDMRRWARIVRPLMEWIGYIHTVNWLLGPVTLLGSAMSVGILAAALTYFSHLSFLYLMLWVVGVTILVGGGSSFLLGLLLIKNRVAREDRRQKTTSQAIHDESEVIFTDADTERRWRFGEVSALSDAERARLKMARPDVYRAYSSRLFRDVIIPPEFRGDGGLPIVTPQPVETKEQRLLRPRIHTCTRCGHIYLVPVAPENIILGSWTIECPRCPQKELLRI